MQPELNDGTYVFSSVPPRRGDWAAVLRAA
jgi:hypothetical protein